MEEQESDEDEGDSNVEVLEDAEQELPELAVQALHVPAVRGKVWTRAEKSALTLAINVEKKYLKGIYISFNKCWDIQRFSLTF